jgi:hypothetical protein
MTKVLLIPEGKYVRFLTSLKYDEEQRSVTVGKLSDTTIIFEQSWGFEIGRSIEKQLSLVATETGYPLDAFEIIYD